VALLRLAVTPRTTTVPKSKSRPVTAAAEQPFEDSEHSPVG
jgi:hypothetical protein